MSSISSSVHAIECFANRIIGPAADFAPTDEAVFYQPREGYKQWIREEENRLCCRFYDRTPSRGRRTSSDIASSSTSAVPGDSQGMSALQTRKGGRPRKNEFYEVYMCHRSGSPRTTSANTSKQRKTEPLPCDCKAAIYVTCELAHPEVVKIRYNWRHSGHQPGSLADLTSASITPEMREWIQTKVEENFTWAQFKHMLRLDRNVLQDILNEGTSFPLSLCIGYQVVYHAIRTSLKRKAHLSPMLDDSFQLWGSRITQQDGMFIYKRMDRYASGMFAFGFLSLWQLSVSVTVDKTLINSITTILNKQMLRKHGDIVCLDSTHNTCTDGTQKNCQLYTLVALCRDTGKGAPLAWLITNSDSQYPLQIWLNWLKTSGQYTPNAVMIDNPDTEIAAIRATFGSSCLPHCYLFLACYQSLEKEYRIKDPNLSNPK
ncbi:hypothetical protein EC973_000283 [Apophysomyces ossiformis]|uniref:MULE transposase domain-containing protein n=1 Tax=Apophysomyces ossiformis TaxID=679940 RepID=A0A8H7ENX6_9FUNG|nr:hypothetical protein EC973_000283 [Apophysomyces ossiformis]